MSKSTLYFQHFPSESTSTIIILHGLLGSGDNWRSIAKELTPYMSSYVVDLRNHGNSFHHPKMTYDDLSCDVIDLIHHLKLESVYIMGHSMGGKTAIQCLQKEPNLFKKGIIVDIAPVEYKPHHDDVLNALKAIVPNKYKTRTDIDKELQKHINDLSIRQLMMKNIKRNTTGVFEWKCNVNAILNNYSAIMQKGHTSTPVNTNTLFIKGEKSDYILNAHLKEIRSLFANVETTTIPNTGHWVQAEAPEVFLKTVTRFLS